VTAEHLEPTASSRLFGGASGRQMGWMLSLIGLASFSSSAVGVLVPELTVDFAEVNLVPWVVTAFLLTSTIVMVAAGWLVDVLGLRNSMRWSAVVYLVASAACAAAPSIEALVAARALQGVGAGWGLTAAIAGIGLSVPPTHRARAFAANSIVWGGVTLLAPVVAAAAAPLVGWRGLFVLNAAAATPVSLLGWRSFPRRGPRVAQRFDLLGMVLLSGVVTLLALWSAGVELGGPVAAGMAAAGLFAVYLWHSGRRGAAIIDRPLIVARPFVLIHLAGAASFGVVVGLDSYLPLYMRATSGGGALHTALPVLAISAGWTAATIVVARVVRPGSEAASATVGYGLVLAGLSMFVVVVGGAAGACPLFYLAVVLLGVGAGTVSSSMFVLLQRCADLDAMGRATSAHQLARGIGQTSGSAAVAATILAVVSERLGDSSALRPMLDGASGDTAEGVGTAVAVGMRRAGLLLSSAVFLGLCASVLLIRATATRRR
jgi:MFS family permease